MTFIYVDYQSRGIQIGYGEFPAISTDITGTITVSESYDNKMILSIGSYAFSECKFEQIILPDSIEILGSHSFHLSSLKSFTSPKSLKIVGNHSFWYSSILTLDLSTCESEDFQGVVCFADTPLYDVKFPVSLTKISSWNFKNCSLINLTITRNIKTIESAAFIDCQNLSFIVSESPHFVVHNGVLYSKDYKTMYIYPSNSFVDILPTVRYIGNCRAFSGTSLVNFTLKVPLISTSGMLFRRCFSLVRADLTCGRFKYLFTNDFGACTSLTEILLPDTIVAMDTLVFNGCTNLKTIILPKGLKDGNTGLDRSWFTDIYYCGTNLVKGYISRSLNIHVTANYPGNIFMGQTITDKNAVCEMKRCENPSPNAWIEPTINPCYYFPIHMALVSPMILFILSDSE